MFFFNQFVKIEMNNQKILKKFTNLIMRDGKKSIANKVLMSSINTASKQLGLTEDQLLNECLNNVKPSAIDNLLINHIQKLGNSYICEPQLCYHNDSFISDVSNFGKPNIIGRGKYNELRLNYFE